MLTPHRSLVAILVEAWLVVSVIRASLGVCVCCAADHPQLHSLKQQQFISNDSVDGQGVLLLHVISAPRSKMAPLRCLATSAGHTTGAPWGPSAEWLWSPPRGLFSRLLVLPHSVGLSGQPDC